MKLSNLVHAVPLPDGALPSLGHGPVSPSERPHSPASHPACRSTCSSLHSSSLHNLSFHREQAGGLALEALHPAPTHYAADAPALPSSLPHPVPRAVLQGLTQGICLETDGWMMKKRVKRPFRLVSIPLTPSAKSSASQPLHKVRA
jgi:hypothetical protein